MVSEPIEGAAALVSEPSPGAAALLSEPSVRSLGLVSEPYAGEPTTAGVDSVGAAGLAMVVAAGAKS